MNESNSDMNLLSLANGLAAKGPVMVLESQLTSHPAGRTSYLAARPKTLISATGDRVRICEEGRVREYEGDPWSYLERIHREQGDWLFGYLGYDLKNHLEDLSSANPDPVGVPELMLMIPELLLEFDENSGRYRYLKGSPDEVNGIPQDELKSFSLTGFSTGVDKREYIGMIREAQHRITEGDFYEINLSHQIRARFKGAPLDLYRRMKKVGPVPFAAYLHTDDFDVCCQSPERFLKKSGDRVISQPIKGTIDRGRSEEEDRERLEKLQGSEKDRAENLMIVDLVRNDLSRIARKGTVKVSKLFEIQTFGTVHQMVSTVEAQVKESNPIAIIKACFPMGSMTGAPKISAMKSIEELENYKRGIYSGAIGFITPDGDFDFNVVIRTAIIKSGQLAYPVGGAITSDSDPESEWDETLIKARALTRVQESNSV